MPCREFLSTPSARRATLNADSWMRSWSHFIHALREEGDSKTAQKRAILNVQEG